jgi:hypothetical protein
MSHRIQVQACAGPGSIGTGRSQASGRKAFSNKQNDSKRFPNDPVLKIKNTDSSKGEETKKRQQLVAPLHEADVGVRLFPCQRKNRLSIFSFIGKVPPIWQVR